MSTDFHRFCQTYTTKKLQRKICNNPPYAVNVAALRAVPGKMLITTYVQLVDTGVAAHSNLLR